MNESAKEKEKAPIYEMLIAHALKRTTPFHVPGHKQRSQQFDNGLNQEQAALDTLMSIDITELSGTDDLHDPSGAIARAQELAADCYGADETRFLVGGSTSGNLAMILGVCEPGELVLAQRNVHKSIIHGLALSGARCVFLEPSVDTRSGIAIAPTAATVSAAIAQYPEAKAIILCSPNYYGMTADVRTIVELAHAADMPVLVDEAHGAHFGHHPELPQSALQMGADIVVQSTHKMLSSLTMTAMLHMQGQLAPKPAIRQALRMVQSSSPSYPLMASLDLARRQLHTQGAAVFEPALDVARSIRRATAGLPFELLHADDPLKLSLKDASGQLSGVALHDMLERRGCLAEMADASYVVLALGPGTRQQDGEALIAALTNIAKEMEPKPEEACAANANIERVEEWSRQAQIPEPVTIKRRIAATTPVPLRAAAGHVCGEWIIPYPPGIPLLYPGELIGERVVAKLERLRDAGARFQGATDVSLNEIQVLSEGDRL